jgi:hypothetical protein
VEEEGKREEERVRKESWRRVGKKRKRMRRVGIKRR